MLFAPPKVAAPAPEAMVTLALAPRRKTEPAVPVLLMERADI